MEWNKSRHRYCLFLFVTTSLSDKQVAQHMSERYSDKCTVHSIRSLRGRLEREGKLKRGIAGSSSKETVMKKVIRREKWTKMAEQRARDLHLDGCKPKVIARMLKKEGLRKGYNPGAVGDRISDLKRRGWLKKPIPGLRRKVVRRPVKKVAPPTRGSTNTITLKSNKWEDVLPAQMVFDNISDYVFIRIVELCLREKFGVN